MADSTVARRYARALLELAEEAGQVDELGQQLARFLEVLRTEDGILLRVLSNPVFTQEERMAVVNDVLPRLQLHALCQNLVRLLVERGRMAALPDIVQLYLGAADEHAGRTRVTVTTAEPLTGRLENEIRTALAKATGRDILLETVVDPALIGGMIARVDDKVYDASLRTRLANLRQSLMNAQIPAEA